MTLKYRLKRWLNFWSVLLLLAFLGKWIYQENYFIFEPLLQFLFFIIQRKAWCHGGGGGAFPFLSPLSLFQFSPPPQILPHQEKGDFIHITLSALNKFRVPFQAFLFVSIRKHNLVTIFECVNLVFTPSRRRGLNMQIATRLWSYFNYDRTQSSLYSSQPDPDHYQAQDRD